jgi:hypothetical protein
MPEYCGEFPRRVPVLFDSVPRLGLRPERVADERPGRNQQAAQHLRANDPGFWLLTSGSISRRDIKGEALGWLGDVWCESATVSSGIAAFRKRVDNSQREGTTTTALLEMAPSCLPIFGLRA